MREGVPDVSVVICHHVGRTLVTRCLESVYLSEGVTYEVLVITSDGTFEHPRATVIYQQGGPAHKRNVGTVRSRAECIVYLDDDVEISPYCLYQFWLWLKEHPRCGMAFAKIYKMAEGRRDEFDDVGSWLTWTGFLYSRAGTRLRDGGQFDTPCRVLSSKSATCALRRSAFLQVGGFDASYYILGEETDVSYRVWLLGY